MVLDGEMRKLKFSANCAKHAHESADACHVTQSYVTTLLSEQLKTYGFQTEIIMQEDEKLAVSVEDHPVALGVNCSVKDENGLLVCEINAHADEAQDWFTKIETQSVIKQLAQAVESSLKKDDAFSEFEWKV